MLAAGALGWKIIAGGVVFIGALSGGHAVSGHRVANSTSNLTVVYHSTSGSQATFKVVCLPRSSTGTHPNKKAICAAIAKQGIRLFAPVPANMMCSQIYGGPQTATIAGTVNGRRMNSTFSRTDGCQVARWNRAKVLFTFPGYSTVSGRIEVSPTCGGPVQPGQNCVNPSVDGRAIFAPSSNSNSGSKVTGIATAENGFSILLRNGTWNVSGTTRDSIAMRCATSTITVPTSGEVVVSCDTGIR
jgi:hypothetical protein